MFQFSQRQFCAWLFVNHFFVAREPVSCLFFTCFLLTRLLLTDLWLNDLIVTCWFFNHLVVTCYFFTHFTFIDSIVTPLLYSFFLFSAVRERYHMQDYKEQAIKIPFSTILTWLIFPRTGKICLRVCLFYSCSCFQIYNCKIFIGNSMIWSDNYIG